MAKFTIYNFSNNIEIECTNSEMKNAIRCMPNLLETYEIRELLQIMLDNMTQKQIEKTLNACHNLSPSQTNLRLIECGLIEEN